ncbi:polysaccharide deacetylase family protein [Luteolibacter ambystomatis]|uniref:Polysaccharide deacetylase family protein n=1 Tax=Luteolibacter ambystomatis TaxID=2824561 RepID=A0A975PGN5_9BACT|nr:polysaccharide deacetylase family protein [Luteolibacter ambystomatis]QUE52482.1 polysaccharide deacetylase family protein [Luteolibacter ambystomatis]
MFRRFFIALFSAATLLHAQEPAPAPAAPPAPPAEPPVIQDDATRVAVLGYHELSETQPETAMRIRTSKFRKQMETIRQLGITVISLDDYLAWRRGQKTLPERCMLITLDDGWKSVYTDAYPILKEFNYPFVLYLYKEYIDVGGKSMSSAMIEEMQKNGAAIGSHSVSHPFPSTVKSHAKKGPDDYDAFLRKELGESKRFLESKFNCKVASYAYPGGYHTDEMFKLADEFGYDNLFTVIPGKVKRSTPAMTVPRYMIFGNNDKIFELASSFREGGAVAGAPGNAPGVAQTTPVPVSPEAGAVINNRLPLITADLATIADLDPASVVMKVAGFGEVPAQFDPKAKRVSWRVNRKLRQPGCQVTVTWKDTKGKAPETPLRWSFQIDRDAAYLPDDSQQ